MYGQMNRNMRRSLAGAMDPTQMMRQAQMRQGVGMGGAAPTPGGGMGNPMMQAQGAPQVMGMPPIMSPLQQAPQGQLNPQALMQMLQQQQAQRWQQQQQALAASRAPQTTAEQAPQQTSGFANLMSGLPGGMHPLMSKVLNQWNTSHPDWDWSQR